MYDVCVLNYLDFFKVEWYLGEGQNSVNFCKFISSNLWSSFQKNLRKPYMLGDIFTGVAKLFKMVHPSSRSKFWRLSWAKISKLFCGGIWKEIIWEITSEGIWISYLQQFFLSLLISWELKSLLPLDFAWIFFTAQNWISLKFLWWGVSLHLAWAKLNCFTCYFCLFPEISWFCYLCYNFNLTLMSTFIALGWPHVVDTPRNSRN